MQWKDSPRFRTTTHSTILSTDQAYSSSIKIIPLLNKQVTTLSIVIVSIVMPSNFVTYFIEHCQYVPFKFPHSLYNLYQSHTSPCSQSWRSNLEFWSIHNFSGIDSEIDWIFTLDYCGLMHAQLQAAFNAPAENTP